MSKIVRVVCYLTLCLLRAWWTHDNTFVPPSCTPALLYTFLGFLSVCCTCAVRVLYSRGFCTQGLFRFETCFVALYE